MSKHDDEDTRILTRGLALSIIPLGLLLLALIVFPFFKPIKPDHDIFPYEPSYAELGCIVLTLILLGLAVVLPAISIRREVQKRKVSTYLPKEHGDH